MAAPQVTSENWDTAWTLIERAKKKGIKDNYFNKPTVLGYFQANAQDKETGGKEISVPVEYAPTTGKWFSGHDPLDTTEPEIVTMATVKWAYFAAPVVIAFDTEMESRNAAFAKSVIEVRMDNAIKSVKNDMDIALMSAKSGKSCLGLQDWIANTPTSGTVAGIDRATYTWWRNTYGATSTDFDATTAEEIWDGPAYINTLWNSACDGDDVIDLWVTTPTFYGTYENILNSGNMFRFMAPQNSKMALYNGSPVLKNAPVIFNRNCASGKWYGLNNNVLRLQNQEGIDFLKTPFRSPHNQLTKIAYVVHSVQLLGWNPRRTLVATTLT